MSKRTSEDLLFASHKKHHKKGTESEDSLDISESEHQDWENEEQDYELRPRFTDLTQGEEGLPIKKGGILKRVGRKAKEELAEADVNNFDSGDVQDPKYSEIKKEAVGARVLSAQEKLVKLKEEIASLATDLLDNPEENVNSLNKLRRHAESDELAKSQIAILALVPVFKALAPGYKIRPLTEIEKKARVSREVARTRDLEQGILSNYYRFITFLDENTKRILRSSKSITPLIESRALVSLDAACELALSSLRGFNYNDKLFWILIRNLDSKKMKNLKPSLREKNRKVLETLLKDDDQYGTVSLIITRLLSRKIKKQDFHVDESTLNLFLNLSILDDFITHDNFENKDKFSQKSKKKHLSKKERKARKEAKAITAELQKAETAVSAEEKEENQGQILRIILKLYLEILKAGSQGNHDASKLTASSLEGLSRFGPNANLELLGDFLAVMREAVESLQVNVISSKQQRSDGRIGLYSGGELRQVLLLVATSFVLLLNNKESGKLPFSVDLSAFIGFLYSTLSDISLDADIELSSKSFRLADNSMKDNEAYLPSVNFATRAELLLRCLDYIFFRSKSGSVNRALSFIKRLLMSNLHTPEKTVLANLKFIDKLGGRYGSSMSSMYSTDEKLGEAGNYVLGIESKTERLDLEKSNPEAAVLWEAFLLEKHYCPSIRKAMGILGRKYKDST